jgi:hypothetical protein
VHSLQMKLEDDIRMMSAQEKYSAAILSAINTTQVLVTETRRQVPPPQGRSAAERLKALASRYTMHSERKVHASVAKEPARKQTETEAIRPSPSGTAGSLGDNIELF